MQRNGNILLTLALVRKATFLSFFLYLQIIKGKLSEVIL